MMLEWKDPPLANRAMIDWAAIADELRRHPGEWALVQRDAKAKHVAGYIKKGTLVAFRPPGSFEATQRGSGPYDVYARYVGEQ